MWPVLLVILTKSGFSQKKKGGKIKKNSILQKTSTYVRFFFVMWILTNFKLIFKKP